MSGNANTDWLWDWAIAEAETNSMRVQRDAALKLLGEARAELADNVPYRNPKGEWVCPYCHIRGPEPDALQHFRACEVLQHRDLRERIDALLAEGAGSAHE